MYVYDIIIETFVEFYYRYLNTPSVTIRLDESIKECICASGVDSTQQKSNFLFPDKILYDDQIIAWFALIQIRYNNEFHSCNVAIRWINNAI